MDIGNVADASHAASIFWVRMCRLVIFFVYVINIWLSAWMGDHLKFFVHSQTLKRAVCKSFMVQMEHHHHSVSFRFLPVVFQISALYSYTQTHQSTLYDPDVCMDL
jgi:hypothetical protein